MARRPDAGRPRRSQQGGGGRSGGKQQPRGRGQQRGDKRGAGRPQPDDTVSQLTGPLQKVLARLPETQRRLLEFRMGLADGHPHDLADTARELGVSVGEARDIEQRAFAHIREGLPEQQLQRLHRFLAP